MTPTNASANKANKPRKPVHIYFAYIFAEVVGAALRFCWWLIICNRDGRMHVVVVPQKLQARG